MAQGKVSDLAGLVEYYDKVIETLRKRIELLNKEIVDLSQRKNGLVEFINKEIYKTKAESDKIIAEAKEEADKIIAATDEGRQQNEAESGRLASEWIALGDKEKILTKEKVDLDKKKDDLVKEQANLNNTLGKKIANVDMALSVISTLQQALNSFLCKVNEAIEEIKKLKLE